MKRLLATGTRVHIDLDDGRRIHGVPGSASLHDRTGRAWPKCSVLIMVFPRSGARLATEEEMTGAPRQYLGRTYRGKVSEPIDLPPKALGAWERVGTVSRVKGDKGEIWYSRGGTKHPGRYRHEFNKGGKLVGFFKGEGTVVLYQRGRALRLQLPRGCMLDDRGFVWP